MERIHEGILYQDQHKRYCLYEPGTPPHKHLTCTSGCRMEVWLNRTWIAGHVEGDGEDYWFFADGGGRFLLAERMKARYTEHPWRSDMRDITGSCSSSSIRLTIDIAKSPIEKKEPPMDHSPALPLTLPSLTNDHRQSLLQEQALLSLYEVFSTLADPRSKHGLRYDLAYLLICLVAGLLCNCDSTLAVAQWCRDQQLLLLDLFGPRRFLCPSDSLYRKLLPRLDAEHLEWTLADWIRQTLQAKADDPIALDGKTVRGAATADHAAPHLLSFRTHQSQETLFQVAVSEKTNEIPVAQALLPCLPVEGRVFTADALHTQKEFMRCVDDLGGKTVLTVKNNHPTLYADLTTYFADPHASFQLGSTVDLHRGRIEKRGIRVSTEMNAYLTDWPLIQQVAELTRTVTVRKTGKTTREVVYLVTPLTPTEAGPQRLLELVRGHWSIENASHYVRDVTFREDRSRLRSGHAPHIMAALRNLSITLIHRLSSSQIAATRRHFASHPRHAFDLLLSRRSAQQ